MLRRALWLIASVGCHFQPPLVLLGADGPSDGPLGDGPLDDAISDGAADAPPPDASLPDAPICPAVYLPNANGSSYRLVTTPAAWLDAEADCEDDGFGTHLAIANLSGETETIDSISSASQTWVGLSDRATDDVWLWVSGTSGPNLGSDNQEDCGYFYDGSGGAPGPGPQLQRELCNMTLRYLCECDLVPADPDSY